MKTRSKWFTDHKTSKSTKTTMQHSDAVLLHITVFKDSVLTPHLGATPDAAAHYSHLHVRMSEPRPGWII